MHFINVNSTSTVTIQNNAIGGVKTSSANGHDVELYGIHTSGSGAFTISDNYIGAVNTSE